MELSHGEQRILLDIARRAIIAAVSGRGPMPEEERAEEGLNRHCGCFVTIRRHGRLRGCLGHFTSERPLWRMIAEQAVDSATADPRFPAMSPAELHDFTLEISVLTPLHPIGSIDEIEIGRHGLFIIRGHRRGVLLPQVATEHGWDRLTFLSQTCVKAGLPHDAWREPATSILVFSAEVFHDE